MVLIIKNFGTTSQVKKNSRQSTSRKTHDKDYDLFIHCNLSKIRGEPKSRTKQSLKRLYWSFLKFNRCGFSGPRLLKAGINFFANCCFKTILSCVTLRFHEIPYNIVMSLLSVLLTPFLSFWDEKDKTLKAHRYFRETTEPSWANMGTPQKSQTINRSLQFMRCAYDEISLWRVYCHQHVYKTLLKKNMDPKQKRCDLKVSLDCIARSPVEKFMEKLHSEFIPHINKEIQKLSNIPTFSDGEGNVNVSYLIDNKTYLDGKENIKSIFIGTNQKAILDNISSTQSIINPALGVGGSALVTLGSLGEAKILPDSLNLGLIPNFSINHLQVWSLGNLLISEQVEALTEHLKKYMEEVDDKKRIEKLLRDEQEDPTAFSKNPKDTMPRLQRHIENYIYQEMKLIQECLSDLKSMRPKFKETQDQSSKRRWNQILEPKAPFSQYNFEGAVARANMHSNDNQKEICQATIQLDNGRIYKKLSESVQRFNSYLEIWTKCQARAAHNEKLAWAFINETEQKATNKKTPASQSADDNIELVFFPEKN